MLADLRLRRVEPGSPKEQALLAFQDDQLAELSYPAGDLADVALKLAWAVRLSGAGHGAVPCETARYRLLGSALADVVLLRQGQLVRRRRSARKAEEARRRALARKAAREQAEAAAEGRAAP